MKLNYYEIPVPKEMLEQEMNPKFSPLLEKVGND